MHASELDLCRRSLDPCQMASLVGTTFPSPQHNLVVLGRNFIASLHDIAARNFSPFCAGRVGQEMSRSDRKRSLPWTCL
jgi:hypothetical protein